VALPRVKVTPARPAREAVAVFEALRAERRALVRSKLMMDVCLPE
jgi:hypothetical protein